MTDIQAALGIHQLPRLDDAIDRRAEHWAIYDPALAHLTLVLPAETREHMRHARHLYQVRLGRDVSLTHDELLNALHIRNIGDRGPLAWCPLSLTIVTDMTSIPHRYPMRPKSPKPPSGCPSVASSVIKIEAT